jgi:5-methylcytosine-specific restriction endonuclease McrA
MTRSVPEWIGKNDDHRAPGKVRQRIFGRDNRCHLCGCEIQTAQKWDLDHVVALINGGENREANLRPAHRKCHKEKTARDVAEKAKVAAIRQKHIGARTAPAKPLRGAGFPQTEKAASRHTKAPLPPRQLYRPASFAQEQKP